MNRYRIRVVTATALSCALSLTWGFCFAAPVEKSLAGEWSFSVPGHVSRNVSVPHAWNANPEFADYRGKALYVRAVGDLSAMKGKTVRLSFESVYHTARVSVNGRFVGEHVGGYTPFSFDVTEAVDFAPDAKNEIRVEVDNAPADCMFPYQMKYDWACDGGIYRNVSLRFTDGPGIRYVHLDPEFATGEVRVETKLWDGTLAHSSFKVENPIPWHFDRPHLYTYTAQAGGDERVVRYGFRELKVVRDGFVFNGEKVRLAGLEAMPGSNPAYGMAEPAAYQRKTVEMLRGANATLTRFHWVQPEATLDACDERGILVQEELSWWGGPNDLTDTQLALAKRLVAEMIEAHYNHPCVVSWGLLNEVGANHQTLSKLADATRSLDNRRFLIAPCNDTHWLFGGSCCFLLDVPTWNEYAGTWYGAVERLPGFLDKIGGIAPERPLLITEAGVCEPRFAGGDARRVSEMIYHLREWQKRPFIIGYIYFCLNDYRTDVGEEGFGVDRIRRHGLADKCLRPKDSYGILSALASPVEIKSVEATDKSNRKVKVTLGVRDTIPCYEVRGYALAYVANDGSEHTVQLPDMKPGASQVFELADIGSEYHFEVRRPTGDVCIRY